MPSPRQTTPLLAIAPLAVVVTACASFPPDGPSVMALPGSGLSWASFRAADDGCRQYASLAIGGATPATTAVNAGVTSAAVGTAVGAAVGAAIDGSSGAAVGAGMGLLVGGASGAAAGNASAYELQQRYDQNYLQCMYARGHKVPVVGGVSAPGAPHRAASASLPPPPAPPRGAPPPPPPPGAAPAPSAR